MGFSRVGSGRLLAPPIYRLAFGILTAGFALWTIGLYVTGFNLITLLDVVTIAVACCALALKDTRMVRVGVTVAAVAVALAGALLIDASVPTGIDNSAEMLLSRPANPWWMFVVLGLGVVVGLLLSSRRRLYVTTSILS